MPIEPPLKRAIVFFDGQNLFHAVRQSFGEQDRWIKLACAFPVSPTAQNRRGINKTDWITIDRATYDACIDARDYRPQPGSTQRHT
jgi:hypothetical protein